MFSNSGYACEGSESVGSHRRSRRALVEPLLSVVRPGGRPEAHPRCELVNAILYLLRTGCSWRQLPKDFPPWETVYWHFKRWRDDGSLDALHDTLRERVREAEGRDPQPTVAIIDAQSVKGRGHRFSRDARVRRGQEGQWPQASHRGRHDRAAGDRDRSPLPTSRTAAARARCSPRCARRSR